jgi:hypothetical protein
MDISEALTASIIKAIALKIEALSHSETSFNFMDCTE